MQTSGAFTAAYLELIPQLELLTKKNDRRNVYRDGETSIPNRLRRGEPVDVVIVADAVLVGFIKDGLIMADGYTPLARSAIGMAVRAGALAGHRHGRRTEAHASASEIHRVLRQRERRISYHGALSALGHSRPGDE